MYHVISRCYQSVTVKGPAGTLIFTHSAIERAKRRSQKNSVIRKPVAVHIDAVGYLFTEKEWDSGWQRVEGPFRRQIQQLINEQFNDQRMVSPRLSKQRADGIRRKADTTFHLRTER